MALGEIHNYLSNKIKCANKLRTRALPSEAQKEIRGARTGKPSLHLKSHEVNVVEDSDNECAFEDWIYPTTEGKPNNWHARDFVPISFIEK